MSAVRGTGLNEVCTCSHGRRSYGGHADMYTYFLK